MYAKLPAEANKPLDKQGYICWYESSCWRDPEKRWYRGKVGTYSRDYVSYIAKEEPIDSEMGNLEYMEACESVVDLQDM